MLVTGGSFKFFALRNSILSINLEYISSALNHAAQYEATIAQADTPKIASIFDSSQLSSKALMIHKV
ncbi:hypothetical protein J6V86_00720 [bacterium]|nr:hypothetical protein [bacterium]